MGQARTTGPASDRHDIIDPTHKTDPAWLKGEHDYQEAETKPGISLFMVLVVSATTTGTTLAQPAAANPALVQIDSGKVLGTAANDVVAFRGIPFA